jgi:hypothetical protein
MGGYVIQSTNIFKRLQVGDLTLQQVGVTLATSLIACICAYILKSGFRIMLAAGSYR